MHFELIDYSALYFKSIKKIDVPRRRIGKFVQMFNEAEKKEYVILSPKEFSVYHANIVERFCIVQEIAGVYSSKDYFTVHEFDWSVIGGGFWVIDQDKKILELYGASKGYGPFADNGIKGKILRSGLLPGYSIIVTGS